MPTYDGGVTVSGGASLTLRLETSENTYPGSNSSTINYTLKLIRNSGFAYNLNSNGLSWSTNIGGYTNSGSTSYDFRAYSELVLVSTTTGSITHESDGSKTISVSGSISGPGPITAGSAGGSMTLTTYNLAAGSRWTGSTWTDCTTNKRWNGSAWVDLTIKKRWSGSAWVDLS